MNRMLGVMMLLFVIGTEVVGLAQWLSPPDREFPVVNVSAVAGSAR